MLPLSLLLTVALAALAQADRTKSTFFSAAVVNLPLVGVGRPCASDAHVRR